MALVTISYVQVVTAMRVDLDAPGPIVPVPAAILVVFSETAVVEEPQWLNELGGGHVQVNSLVIAHVSRIT